jgi:hypothetical protein
MPFSLEVISSEKKEERGMNISHKFLHLSDYVSNMRRKKIFPPSEEQ